VKTYFIGIGSNVSGSKYATSLATAQGAARWLQQEGLCDAISNWYQSPPDPPMPNQGDFFNGVGMLKTNTEPAKLLRQLQAVESQFGRTRKFKNEARTLDLDIIAMNEEAVAEPHIPHPRMHLRPFVLMPMAELTPNWHHPTLKKTISQLIEELPTSRINKCVP